MVHEYAAIDILALIFPTSVYLKLIEKRHPHEPAIAHLEEIVKQMTPEQKAYVQARVRTFKAYTEAMEKAMGQGGQRAAAA
jgi:hypothetical protein